LNWLNNASTGDLYDDKKENEGDENPYGMKSSWFSAQINDILAISKFSGRGKVEKAVPDNEEITERSCE